MSTVDASFQLDSSGVHDAFSSGFKFRLEKQGIQMYFLAWPIAVP